MEKNEKTNQEMKKRICSAIICILVLILTLIMHNTIILTILIALVSGIAVYEILVPTKFLSSDKVGICCAIFTGLSIIIFKKYEPIYMYSIILFLTCLIGYMLIAHNKFSFNQLSICAFTIIVISFSLSRILVMNEINGGIIYLILICIAAWLTDTGAFFIGKKFGKRKIAPKISPNKTLEGLIGGLTVTSIIFPFTCYIYSHYVLMDLEVSLVNAIIVGIICACLGIVGDLFASAIKREAGIKDYGNIIPGHGGIMDRFDSFLFVAPTLYILIQILPIFNF